MGDNEVQASYETLLTYLREYSLEPGLTQASIVLVLKQIHKRLYALLCWQLELQPKVAPDDMLWLSECVSDVVQCIPLLAQGFYKASKVLHRSAVENFMRYIIVRNGGTLDGITTVPQLFEALKTLPCGANTEVQSRVASMRNKYALLCNYVHSSGADYMALAKALKQYPTVNETLLSSTSEELKKTLHKMNGLLLILERPIFDAMYHGNKESILDNLQANEKRALV